MTGDLVTLEEAVARSVKVDRLAGHLDRELRALGATDATLVADAAEHLTDEALASLARRHGIRHPSALTCRCVRRLLRIRAEEAAQADPFAGFAR